MGKLEMCDELIALGWPVERLPEIEEMNFLELKKLLTDWRKGEQRLDVARKLGADEDQAQEIVRWAGRQLDHLRAVCLRAGVAPGIKSDLLRTSAVILSGIVANPNEASDHPVELAKRAVNLAVALKVEIETLQNADIRCGKGGPGGNTPSEV